MLNNRDQSAHLIYIQCTKEPLEKKSVGKFTNKIYAFNIVAKYLMGQETSKSKE